MTGLSSLNITYEVEQEYHGSKGWKLVRVHTIDDRKSFGAVVTTYARESTARKAASFLAKLVEDENDAIKYRAYEAEMAAGLVKIEAARAVTESLKD